MMTKPPARLYARFKNNLAAESVLKSVAETLSAAQKDVSALFERGNGIAESYEVSAIYTRYGFHNDCGWQQTTPIFVEGATIYWEIPDGMLIDEAENLLAAFGALSIRKEDAFDEDLLRSVPHPAALFLSEIDDMQEYDEDDAARLESCDKKTIH